MAYRSRGRSYGKKRGFGKRRGSSRSKSRRYKTYNMARGGVRL